MASHKIVYYSPDRRFRISADPGGSVFTVESVDGQLGLVARFTILRQLQDWLSERGYALADLIQD